MNTEIDILMDIYTDLTNNIEHIKRSKNNLIKINNNIKHLNNNYFETNFDYQLINEYINISDSVEKYHKLLNNLNNKLYYIKHKINIICDHEWVNDIIDIDPDCSRYICYCVKCDVTKK